MSKQGNLYNKYNFSLNAYSFGSTALDTIRTPTKTLKNVLGGLQHMQQFHQVIL